MTVHPGLLVAAFAFLSLLPVHTLEAESRFEDVRLIVGRHGKALFRAEGFDDVPGVLVSDAEARQLRFDTGRRTLFGFEASFDRLTGLHYEESAYPRLSFFRSRAYLTIHYMSATGESRVDIFRFSKDSAPALLAALERDTGLIVDRSSAATSFLGLPIHLAVGDSVYVTDEAGGRTKGTVTRLLPSSIELGSSGRLEAASVRKIEVDDPIWDGAANGAGYALAPAMVLMTGCAFTSDDKCGLHGLGVLAGGALAGALIDAKVMRDAYRRTQGNQSRRVQWTPVLASTRKGVLVWLNF